MNRNPHNTGIPLRDGSRYAAKNAVFPRIHTWRPSCNLIRCLFLPEHRPGGTGILGAFTRREAGPKPRREAAREFSMITFTSKIQTVFFEKEDWDGLDDFLLGEARHAGIRVGEEGQFGVLTDRSDDRAVTERVAEALCSAVDPERAERIYALMEEEELDAMTADLRRNCY